MTNIVKVFGNKTLGEGDDGTVQYIEVAATILLPHEKTWKYKKEDEFIFVSATDGLITILGEIGVTILPLANAAITKKGSNVTVKYEGDNTYLMWGNV